MLDLTLFKRPAMCGVSLTAFTLSASIFALFLYLTLYIQDDLGYGPLAAGVRFLPLTVLAFIVAPIAGKLTVRIQLAVPARDRPPAHRRRLRPHGHHQGRLQLDRAAARLHRGRHRHRHGQPGAGLVGHLGGAARAQRHGLGGQQHLPAGRDRHRHRRAGLGLPVPAAEPHAERPPGHPGRAGGAGPRRAGHPERHPRRGRPPGGRGHPLGDGAVGARSTPTGPGSRPPSTRSCSSGRSSP